MALLSIIRAENVKRHLDVPPRQSRQKLICWGPGRSKYVHDCLHPEWYQVRSTVTQCLR